MSWVETKLGDALRFYNGKAGKYEGGNYPVYGSNGLIGKSDTAIFDNGIIIGRVGAYCGAIQYCPSQFWASDNTIVVKNQDGYDIKYLAYLLEIMDLNQFAGGSAQPLLTHGWIKPISTKMPPLLIQQKIAGILSAYDDLIENNLKRIKLLEELAQITYEQWFVRLRFPGHESTPINPETNLPEGWERKTNGDCCDVSGGGTPSKTKPEYWDEGDVTWFSPTDLSKARSLCLLDSSAKITELGLQKSSAKLMPPESFMMTSRATIGLFGLIDKPYSTNQGFINVMPHSTHHEYFLLFNFKSRVDEFFSHATGATFPEISKSKFKRLVINWPDEVTLRNFHDKCRPIIQEMMNLTKQNKRLREARDILLPRLMTGMIDVEQYDPA